VRKIVSFILCCIMLFPCAPLPAVWADTPDGGLPQTSEEYAASDYAKYGARMAAGINHAAIVKLDGTVVAWGNDTYGQTDVPAGLSGVKAIAAGKNHTLALKEDGTLAGWGVYNIGADTAVYTIPSELEGEHFKSITAGEDMSAAVKTDGTVVVWGPYSDSLKSGAAGLSNVVSVAINNSGAAALDKSGLVACWGSITATGKPAGSDTIAVAPGSRHFVALSAGGTATAWGHTSMINTNVKKISNCSNVVAVGAGRTLAAALLSDGTVKAFPTSGTSAIPVNWDGESLDAATSIGAVYIAPVNISGKASPALVMQKNGNVVAYCHNKELETSEDQINPILTEMPEGLNLMTDSLSGNADLKGLAPEGYSLYPAFDPKVADYTVVVPDEAAGVTVTATASSGKASLRINGAKVQSGVGYVVNNLAEGNNSVPIKVTAENGTNKIYNLTVIREGAALSENADLCSLDLAGCGLSPAFDKTATGYAVNVPNEAVSVTVTAITISNKASLTINGVAVPGGTSHAVNGLTEGANQIEIKVTAENGTEKTYNLTVTRADHIKDSNNNLYGLAVEGCSLNPSFKMLETSYTAIVSIGITGVTVTAIAASDKAAIKINGEDALSGAPHIVNDLVVGQNLIEIVVTAEDGKTKIYAVTVERKTYELSTNAALSALSVEGCSFSPEFDPEVDAYAITVSEEVTCAAITATTSSNKAALTVSSSVILKTATSGAVSMIGLFVGTNTIEIKVTAEAGNTRTYTITANVPEYTGPPADIPKTVKEYYSSEYIRALDKITGTGDYLFIDEDGSVLKYNSDNSNSFGSYDLPENLGRVKQIALGLNNVMALRQDGTVAVWGYDAEGYCSVPAEATDIKEIAASRNSFYALKNDGTVVAWGDNTYHQKDVPTGLSGVERIVSGKLCSSCLALKSDGTVVAWGDDGSGMCNVPAGLSGVADLIVSGSNCFALKEDGTVAAWGKNNFGLCNVPSVLKNVSYIIAEETYAVAVKDDGSVVIWGDNTGGRCDVPEGLKDVVSVAGNGIGCMAAVKSDGTVAVWGNSSFNLSPLPAGLHDVTRVFIGGNGFAAAVKKDGTITAWGKTSNDSFNYKAQLLRRAKDAVQINNTFILHRGGELECYGCYEDDIAGLQEVANGVNLLSGHCFAVNDAALLDSGGNKATSVTAGETYQIKAGIRNYYCEDAEGTVFIQVRGGEGADASGGGRVLSCFRLKKTVPLDGTTVSADFTMPENVTGSIYIDLFVWDKGDKPVPKTEPDQSLMFMVNEI